MPGTHPRCSKPACPACLRWAMFVRARSSAWAAPLAKVRRRSRPFTSAFPGRRRWRSVVRLVRHPSGFGMRAYAAEPDSHLPTFTVDIPLPLEKRIMSDPKRIDVYSWPTPNGHKVHIMLEECGLPYRAHPVNISKGDQFAPEFLAICPNNKIPAIVDPNGPDGQPISLFESGAILLYLASKTGRFLP